MWFLRSTTNTFLLSWLAIRSANTRPVNPAPTMSQSTFMSPSCNKGWQQGFEITDVLFGPFELYPDAAEVRLASHECEVCHFIRGSRFAAISSSAGGGTRTRTRLPSPDFES